MAVYGESVSLGSLYHESIDILAATVNHAGVPTCFAFALSAMLWKRAFAFFGAGTVFGLACEALINALREGDSLDMFAVLAMRSCM